VLTKPKATKPGNSDIGLGLEKRLKIELGLGIMVRGRFKNEGSGYG